MLLPRLKVDRCRGPLNARRASPQAIANDWAPTSGRTTARPRQSESAESRRAPRPADQSPSVAADVPRAKALAVLDFPPAAPGDAIRRTPSSLPRRRAPNAAIAPQPPRRSCRSRVSCASPPTARPTRSPADRGPRSATCGCAGRSDRALHRAVVVMVRQVASSPHRPAARGLARPICWHKGGRASISAAARSWRADREAASLAPPCATPHRRRQVPSAGRRFAATTHQWRRCAWAAALFREFPGAFVVGRLEPLLRTSAGFLGRGTPPVALVVRSLTSRPARVAYSASRGWRFFVVRLKSAMAASKRQADCISSAVRKAAPGVPADR